MPGRIVAAWRIDTTPPQRVQIPEHWLGNPALGEPYAAEYPTTESAPPEQTSDEQPAGDSATDEAAEIPATPARKGSKPRGTGDKED